MTLVPPFVPPRRHGRALTWDGPEPSDRSKLMSDLGPILLFDGVCNFCNGVVNFVLDHDRQGRFRFAALQSDTGKRLLAEHGLADLPLSTSVLIEGGRAYLDSDGILRASILLGGPFRLLAPLLLVPRVLRNAAYRAFA